MRDYFGEYAGYAQQYLFHDARKSKLVVTELLLLACVATATASVCPRRGWLAGALEPALQRLDVPLHHAPAPDVQGEAFAPRRVQRDTGGCELAEGEPSGRPLVQRIDVPGRDRRLRKRAQSTGSAFTLTFAGASFFSTGFFAFGAAFFGFSSYGAFATFLVLATLARAFRWRLLPLGLCLLLCRCAHVYCFLTLLPRTARITPSAASDDSGSDYLDALEDEVSGHRNRVKRRARLARSRRRAALRCSATPG